MLCVTDPSFKRCNYCDNFKIHKYTDNTAWSLRGRDFLGTGMCTYHKNFVNVISSHRTIISFLVKVNPAPRIQEDNP